MVKLIKRKLAWDLKGRLDGIKITSLARRPRANPSILLLTYRHTDIHTYIQTDRQTDRQTFGFYIIKYRHWWDDID